MIDIDAYRRRMDNMELGHRSNPNILSMQEEQFALYDHSTLANFQNRLRQYHEMLSSLKKLGYEYKLFSKSGRDTSQPWIFVYVKGDAYAAGVMRYNTIRNNGAGERMWGWELVCRHFNNKRYSINEFEFYRKTTTDFFKAVKLVKTGFRRWTAPEYVQVASNYMDRVTERTAVNHNRNAKDFVAKHLGCEDVLGYLGARLHQLDTYPWFNEFVHLHETSSFSNAEFGANFATCLEMVNESKRLKGHAEARTFTHVYVNHALDRFECTTINGYGDYWLTSRANYEHDIEMADMTTSLYVQGDLPDSIMGAISTLSTLKDHEYVTGVGLRITEDLYCVTT